MAAEHGLRVLGQDLDAALTREWLVTDGLGGYASGTVAGPHTRRYHGLLVAPLAPPLGRHVLLSKLDETVHSQGGTYQLATNEFEGGHVSPQGFVHLAEFVLEDGLPVWRYTIGETRLEKRVWMERGRTVTYVSYRLEGDAPATLSLVPLCSFREFHHETVGSDDWRFQVQHHEYGLTIHAYAGAMPYHLLVRPPAGREWRHGGHQAWWWHFLHREERARGQDFLDDCYAAGEISCELHPGETLVLAATVEEPEQVARAWAGELAATGPQSNAFAAMAPLPPTPSPTRGEGEHSSAAPSLLMASTKGVSSRIAPLLPGGGGAGGEGVFLAQLRRAAHQFLVTRPIPGDETPRAAGGTPQAGTVLAGYHWFGDWGRDTFIALPGLAQATGRHDECRAIVRTFARYVNQGMLPNRFPDTGAPLGTGDYNTVDASLWFVHAVDKLDRLSGGGLVPEMYGTLAQIVDWHVRGTHFGIRVDPADGLLRVDNPQLTWMDAKVGDWVCTPRDGKPVEIAALWHHALSLMTHWASLLERPGAEMRRYRELRAAVEDSFAERFWNPTSGCLYDTVDGAAGLDGSVRPNQVVAAALPDCPLSDGERKRVVDVVVERLWTPRGLRTLDPADGRYRGHYGGDVWSRDGAYHQGTVWPWLLGPLVDAHLLVYRDKAAARRLVAPFEQHLFDEACAGSINEIFDGDAPHAPRGCVAQAWSVSEVFRAWTATEQDTPAATGGTERGTATSAAQ